MYIKVQLYNDIGFSAEAEPRYSCPQTEPFKLAGHLCQNAQHIHPPAHWQGEANVHIAQKKYDVVCKSWDLGYLGGNVLV